MRHRNEFIQHLVKSFEKLRQEFLMAVVVTVLVTVSIAVLALVLVKRPGDSRDNHVRVGLSPLIWHQVLI